MIGLDGYTISSGIFPKYLQGRQIISVPLAEKEVMYIRYVLCKEQSLSELGVIYVEALKNMLLDKHRIKLCKYILNKCYLSNLILQYDDINIVKGDLVMLEYVLANFLFMRV